MNTQLKSQRKIQKNGAKRLSVYILSFLFALSPAITMAQQGISSPAEELAGRGIVVQGDVCSGQVILATSLWLIQYFCSDSFGDNPPLC